MVFRQEPIFGFLDLEREERGMCVSQLCVYVWDREVFYQGEGERIKSITRDKYVKTKILFFFLAQTKNIKSKVYFSLFFSWKKAINTSFSTLKRLIHVAGNN